MFFMAMMSFSGFQNYAIILPFVVRQAANPGPPGSPGAPKWERLSPDRGIRW
jgi:hypothetical protein